MITNLSHSIHGTGIFIYIFCKNQLPASSIRDLLITQMEVTNNPWKGHLKLKTPKKATRKNLVDVGRYTVRPMDPASWVPHGSCSSWTRRTSQNWKDIPGNTWLINLVKL